MSLRRKRLKRLRYYRRSVAVQDRFAAACGLELCNFTGDCNFCDAPRSDARCWDLISRGEETEISETVCSDCLPHYYRRHIAELNWYGSREFDRQWRHQCAQEEEW